MPYTLQVANGLVATAFHGQVTSDDFKNFAAELTRIESQATDAPNRITDMSAVDGVNVDFAMMLGLASERRKSSLRNMVRSAVVAPSDFQYGFARMFPMLHYNAKIQIEVFRDKLAALRWIGEGGPGKSHAPHQSAPPFGPKII